MYDGYTHKTIIRIQTRPSRRQQLSHTHLEVRKLTSKLDIQWPPEVRSNPTQCDSQ